MQMVIKMDVRDKKLSVAFSKQPKCCKNCKHRVFEIKHSGFFQAISYKETNDFCAKHKFDVKKFSVCDHFERI